MTKGTRKTNRRLKKTVRKTLGTLFLISAIVVAAIPTEGLQAEEDAVAQAALVKELEGAQLSVSEEGLYRFCYELEIQETAE